MVYLPIIIIVIDKSINYINFDQYNFFCGVARVNKIIDVLQTVKNTFMNFVNKMQFWQTYCEIIELKDKVVKDFFRMKTKVILITSMIMSKRN